MSEPALLAAVAARTFIVFVVLVVGLRLAGKRQTGELNTHDVVFILMVANAVQNAMTKGDGRLTVALVSAGTLMAAGVLHAAVLCRLPWLQPWAVGMPTVVVENGRAFRRSMRREGLTDHELMAAIRGQGLAGIRDVRLALLEMDGSISVIPREQKTHA